MKRFLAMTILATTLAAMGVMPAFAQERDEVQQRMINRKAPIEALKDAGVVGEDNLGYLDFVGGKSNRDAKVKANQDLVNAENADRKIVYEAIAEKGKTTAGHVGRRRAKQIAENEKPGHYIMDEKGNWIKKAPKAKAK